MRNRMRGSAAGLGAFAFGLMLLVVWAAMPTVATAAKPSPGPIPVSVSTAQIAAYWGVNRFAPTSALYDNHQLVPLQPMFYWSEKDGTTPLIAKARPDFEFGWETGALTSDAYVWGLVSAGRNLWFGTVANTLCYAQQTILVGVPGFPPPEDMEGYWKCEFDFTGNPLRHGDWLPPHIYRYDTAYSQPFPELNLLGAGPLAPPLYLMDPDPIQFPDAELLRNRTIGFRSAGASEDVIFLAGPSVSTPGVLPPDDTGIVLFAYRNTEPPEFLAATQLYDYTNVRSWVSYGGQLYVGVGLRNAAPPYGAVLRWTGHVNKDNPYDPETLFQFETVGLLETEAANLAVHDGGTGPRIYVTTWPFLSLDVAAWKPIGLFRSPVIPEGGLPMISSSADRWELLWSITDYDPDFVAALATGGGALESFGDSIYWGTMHVPFAAGLTAFQLSDMYPGIFYGTPPLDDKAVARIVNMLLGSHRSPAVFRGHDVQLRKGPAFRIELVYGEKYLPKAVLPPRGDGVYRIDATAQYATRYTPTFGASGFGNFFNAYIWSAVRTGGQLDGGRPQLWMGTFDWSQPFRVGVQTIAQQLDTSSPMMTLMVRVAQALQPVIENIIANNGTIPDNSLIPHEGADLYRFDLFGGPAVAETLTGLGNDTNYGFRTMVVQSPVGLAVSKPMPLEETLYIGSANAMNLHPLGGWELLQLPPAKKPPACSEATCDDGNPCTTDKCKEGTTDCLHLSRNCNDNNPATADSCDPAASDPESACQHNPISCTGAADCPAGPDECTVPSCGTDGYCAYGPRTCDDGDPSTANRCEPADGCMYSPLCSSPEDCVAPDVCASATCGVGGYCVYAPKCNDNDPTTEDACDAEGLCHFIPIITCDTPDDCPHPACTNVTCEGSRCVESPVICTDGDPCTSDVCNPSTGACTYSPKCDAGLACYGGECLPFTCTIDADCGTGVCAVGTCDTEGGTCVYATRSCDDSDPCTNDYCFVDRGGCYRREITCDEPGQVCVEGACVNLD